MKRMLFYCFLLITINYYNGLASCGSASCPLHTNNSVIKGAFSLRLSHEYINQDQIYVGSNKSFVGAIPQHHDEVSTINQLTSFSLGYGVSDLLSLDLIIPFVQREHTHIHNHQGEQIFDRWNFNGLGDIVLTANVSLYENIDEGSSFKIISGIKLPTGITNAKNDGGEEAEVTIQPGSGSTDFIAGASYTHSFASLPTVSGSMYSAFPITLDVSYRLNNKGTDDYKLGNVLLIHLSTSYKFMERAALLLQVNARLQGHSDVGETSEPEENTGGEWVFISPGAKFYFNEALSIYGYFQLPLYQNVNGIQQTALYNIQVGIQQEMNLFN
jgi:hypothetical protein